MPLEFGLWRVDGGLRWVSPSRPESEQWLEDALEHDLGLLGLNLQVLGRQVGTSFGTRVDLLAIDADGITHVIELKRDKTPRDVVAQALDYGSWVRRLTNTDLREIFGRHLPGEALEVAFEERFGIPLPEELNESHRLIVVASEIDASTERILGYLSEEYGVPINVIFFQHFEDDGRRYLARSWLIDRVEAETRASITHGGTKEPWNGQDFYVAFGEGSHRNWDDARKYGFVSAGGGRWYSKTLESLFVGARVFVHIPKQGYVGVAKVTSPAVPIQKFMVETESGEIPFLAAPHVAPIPEVDADDPDLSEYMVKVDWIKALPREAAIWKKGMFANQNSACALRNSFTLEHLTQGFGLQ